MKKRLFISTGPFSLLNILTIIRQNKEFCENYLITPDYMGNTFFNSINHSIAQKSNEFACILFSKFLNNSYRVDLLADKIQFDNINEVYSCSHIHVTKNICGLFKNATYFLIEEGLSSYMRYFKEHEGAASAYFLFMHDKFDFLNENISINKLDKEIFKDIAASVAADYPFKISFTSDDKVALFLGQYLLFRLGDRAAISFYKRNISLLLSLGYKIIFKTHPRPSEVFQKSLEKDFGGNEFIFWDSPIPVEAYNLDLTAVISASSGGLLTLSHLYNIPAFAAPDIVIQGSRLHDADRFYAQIVKKYVPDVHELFAMGSVHSKRKNDIQEALRVKFRKFINAKPKLSQHTELRKKSNELMVPNIYLNLLKIYEIPKFSQIRLETTNRCGYNCFMCPKRKMTRPVGTMTMEDLQYLIDVFKYIKYEFDVHMHVFGDCLISDDLPDRIHLITSQKPNFTPVIFTTLGYARDRKWLESLFSNGLGKIFISLYGYDHKSYKAVHGVDKFEVVIENLRFLTMLKNRYRFQMRILLDEFDGVYPDKIQGQEYQRLKLKFKSYLRVLDISEEDIGHQVIHRFGNSFSCAPIYEKSTPCSIIWGLRRSHISILWNLDVSICCFDYNGNIIFGNLKENNLEDIYNSKVYRDSIKYLMQHKRNIQSSSPYKICYGCLQSESLYNYDYEYYLTHEYINYKENYA
jgi:MoaA/NifB/PqqE/SkfB family radical SAM enzyme